MSGEAKATVWVVAFICAVITAIVIGVAASTIATSGPETCTRGEVEGQTVYICD